ncbi:cupin domain-containing protein [Psychrobacter sp. HD31]|uniref:JmjC domain-containing protein n=1 Tax=Psychrobacter sp. HD31 TaxID=3112003 RepID=UPI003DA1ECEB
MHIPYCLPNNISPKDFLENYWQKKPLLIKNGLPQLIDIFEPEDILGLALEDEVSSRLITQTPKQNIKEPVLESHFNWTLKNSPLTEADFSHLPPLWTTLVQNLEQWSPDLASLWQAFDFIPQWQRDDIMVSYAPVGGSVGKHYDDYDVFLAQGYGHRRWQLGKYCDENTEFVANQPIRIFDDMGDIIFDEVLEPGDVLYVPPKLSHFGVAQDDCLTFSFGFRRPNIMQILDSLADVATSEPSIFTPMLLEQNLQPSGALKKDSINHIKSQLIELLNSPIGDDLLTQSVAESVSKRQYDILIPEETLNADDVMAQLQAGATLKIDYNSRLIYSTTNDIITIYANGQELTDLSANQISLLQQLADGCCLGYQQLNDMDKLTIMEWLENGWVWLDF